MILPGLISIAFYKRRPSRLQVALGLVATALLSALLGYIQDEGTSRVWLNVALAIVGGVLLYVAILAYLLYRYQPRHPAQAPPAENPAKDSAPRP